MLLPINLESTNNDLCLWDYIEMCYINYIFIIIWFDSMALTGIYWVWVITDHNVSWNLKLRCTFLGSLKEYRSIYKMLFYSNKSPCCNKNPPSNIQFSKAWNIYITSSKVWSKLCRKIHISAYRNASRKIRLSAHRHVGRKIRISVHSNAKASFHTQ